MCLVSLYLPLGFCLSVMPNDQGVLAKSLQALATEDEPTFSQLPKYFVAFNLSRHPLLFHSNTAFGGLLCFFLLPPVGEYHYF